MWIYERYDWMHFDWDKDNKVCADLGQGLFFTDRPCPLIMAYTALCGRFSGQGLCIEIKPCPKIRKTSPKGASDLARHDLWHSQSIAGTISIVRPFILTVSAVSNVISISLSHLRAFAPASRPLSSLLRVF